MQLLSCSNFVSAMHHVPHAPAASNGTGADSGYRLLLDDSILLIDSPKYLADRGNICIIASCLNMYTALATQRITIVSCLLRD